MAKQDVRQGNRLCVLSMRSFYDRAQIYLEWYIHINHMPQYIFRFDNKHFFLSLNSFKGFYRGNFVALKKVHKRSIDLTRSIKKELKLMREVKKWYICSWHLKNFFSCFQFLHSFHLAATWEHCHICGCELWKFQYLHPDKLLHARKSWERVGKRRSKIGQHVCFVTCVWHHEGSNFPSRQWNCIAWQLAVEQLSRRFPMVRETCRFWIQWV